MNSAANVLQATVADHESRLVAIEALLGPGGANLTAIHRRIDSLAKVVDKLKDDKDDDDDDNRPPPVWDTSALISARKDAVISALNEQRATLNAIATLFVPVASPRSETLTPLRPLPLR